MRRQLGAGVKVFTFSAADPDHRQQPTDAQVKDAVGRLTRELNDLALARGQGWTVEDLNIAEMFATSTDASDGKGGWFMFDDGQDLVLRGTCIIRRVD